jgi:hypothetical protein
MKFVGNDEQEPEVESPEISEEGVVTVSVRIVNACTDCGTELSEASFELESHEVADAVVAHRKSCPDRLTAPPPELEVEEDSSERTRREDGKPNTPSRYRRTYYGARVEFTVTCTCGWTVSGSVEDDVAASGMDSLV